MTKETLEDYEDKLKSLQRKQMELLVESDKLAKEMAEASENYYRLSPEHVKVECFQCAGTGMIKDEEGKRIKCPICNMQGYLWMKLYKEVIK